MWVTTGIPNSLSLMMNSNVQRRRSAESSVAGWLVYSRRRLRGLVAPDPDHAGTGFVMEILHLKTLGEVGRIMSTIRRMSAPSPAVGWWRHGDHLF